MKKGDLVSWPAQEGGGRRHGWVEKVKGGEAWVTYGSGNKTTTKPLPLSILKIVEPR